MLFGRAWASGTVHDPPGACDPDASTFPMAASTTSTSKRVSVDPDPAAPVAVMVGRRVAILPAVRGVVTVVAVGAAHDMTSTTASSPKSGVSASPTVETPMS